jgi:deoxyribodipyrimidine photolyase-related protein
MARKPSNSPALRRLVLVLGDQLDLNSDCLWGSGSGFDPQQDAVLMIEAPGEAEQVWNHKARIALFLSAMRHFSHSLRERGVSVHYVGLEDSPEPGLIDRLSTQLRALQPESLWLVEPGAWRLQQDIAAAASNAKVPLRVLDDTHFMSSRADFARWASKYGSSLRMEFFYREMRRNYAVLLDPKAAKPGEPEGGQWNFDAENRKGYPKGGPGLIPPHEQFEPDAITREVLADVERLFPQHPGSLKSFRWPVTREQALLALDGFVNARLVNFGDYQDAMWEGTPFGWHSLLSTSLNLHLLNPREVVAAAEAAYRAGKAPIAAVEGFIRQVLGWREFIRGVYWLEMPGMATANHFNHQRSLPKWFWTGQTHMACARDAIGQTLEHGYAHHIQRLMVTGLFGLLAEIKPSEVSDWYLAVYVDAVEWVELPNVMGMALYADGGRFTSKPYVASGAYIQRMSNHCGGCRYAPDAKTAQSKSKPLCPYTTLYWNFLDKHEAALAANPRTGLMAKNITRMTPEQRQRIRDDAQRVLETLDDL